MTAKSAAKAPVKKPREVSTQKVSSARKGAETRERMLLRAAELFAEHGFAHVGLQQIVEVTGVTKGSLFWHFDNKRQVYVECVKQSVQSTLGNAEEHRIDAVDPNERLHQYLEWIFPALSRNRVTRRLLLRIIIDQDAELLQELMQGPIGQSYATFTQILKELKPRQDKSALSFFVFAITAINDELAELAKVWEPQSRKLVGGKKSIQFIETLVKSW